MADNKRTVYWTAGQPPVDIDEKDILNVLTAEDYYEIKRTGTVTLPNNIRYIPQRFFINMKNLKYIKLPESLEYIGDFAFRNTSLQKVVFPTSLKGIGYGVFAESNIEDADLSHTNLTYLGGNAFDDCDKLKNVILPDSLEILKEHVFSYTSALTHIKLSNNLKTIDTSCFYNSSIENIDLPASLKILATRAFAYCSNLTSVIVPEGVERIEGAVFKSCNNLHEIFLPSTLTYLDNNAIMDCINLKYLFYNGPKENLISALWDPKTLISNLEAKKVQIIPYSTPASISFLDDIILDEKLQLINEYNYDKNGLMIQNDEVIACRKDVTTVVIPNNVKSIGDYAFYYCGNLISVTIPNSVTSIGSHAFVGCKSITHITIPNSVTSIGGSAFSYCRGLTSITIPNSVASIEKYTFSGCSNLKDVYFQGTEKQWNKIKIDKDYNSNKELLNVTIHFNSKNESLIESNESLNEKIVKKDNQYQVQSEKGRNMGTYKTKKEAEKRLNQIEYFKHLNEKVEKHDTLNPKLFDENNHLKKEVRDKVLDIVDEFVSGLQEDGVKINIKDIIIVGSNASYNYNDQSDVDVHIRVDTKSLDCPDNLYPLLYSAYRSIFNKKFDIDFYGIPVELYVETIDEEPEVVEDEKE